MLKVMLPLDFRGKGVACKERGHGLTKRASHHRTHHKLYWSAWIRRGKNLGHTMVKVSKHIDLTGYISSIRLSLNACR